MKTTAIFLTTFFLAVIATSPLQALEIEGVKISDTKAVNGQTLQLNGTGVRTFRFLGVPIKIYVAAFYTPTPLRSYEAVLQSPGPMQFDFTFLRSVNQQQVTEAWTQQMNTSVSFTYPGYEKDRDAFIAMFGALNTGGTETVQLIGTDTVVIDQGVKKGTISGRNFQKAFLSIWFGKNAVSADLTSGLLGK